MSKVSRVIYSREEVKTPWNDGILSLQKDVFSYTGDSTPYRCSNRELVRFKKGEVTYELSNGTPGTTASTFSGCNNQQFGGGHYRYYTVGYSESGISYGSYFTISKTDEEFQKLNHWQDLKNKISSLKSKELIDRLSQLNYRFHQEVNVKIHSWHKRSTDDRKPLRIQIDKWSSGKWEKLSYKDDGTYIKTCSSDGVSWQECS